MTIEGTRKKLKDWVKWKAKCYLATTEIILHLVGQATIVRHSILYNVFLNEKSTIMSVKNLIFSVYLRRKRWNGWVKESRYSFAFEGFKRCLKLRALKGRLRIKNSWINMSSINLPSVENSSLLRNTKDTDNAASKSKVTDKRKRDSFAIAGLFKKGQEVK